MRVVIFTQKLKAFSRLVMQAKVTPICSTDWSKSFSDLAQHIRVSLERVYVLGKWAEIKDLSLNKVSVAGKVLEKSQYTLRQKNSMPVLTLSKEVSLKAGDKVVIFRD